MPWFVQMPHWVLLPGVLGMACAVALSSVLLSRRRLDPACLQSHNDVGGTIFQVIGTLYAVLLAFVIVVVWQAYATADTRAALEAGTVGDLLRDAGMLSGTPRTAFQEALRQYVHATIDDEWPQMAHGASSAAVWTALRRLFTLVAHFEPVTPREVNIHAVLLQQLNDLSSQRRMRLLSAEGVVMPLLWVLLVCGGLMTVGFSAVLGVARLILLPRGCSLSSSITRPQALTMWTAQRGPHTQRMPTHAELEGMGWSSRYGAGQKASGAVDGVEGVAHCETLLDTDNGDLLVHHASR